MALALALGCAAGFVALELGLRAWFHWKVNGAYARLSTSPQPPAVDTARRFFDLIYRVDDADRFYALRHDLDIDAAGVRVRTNSRGFRGPEWTDRASSHSLRILGIGDSTMWGHGVSREDTYLRHIERMLNETLPAPWNVQTINTAVPGYTAAQEAAVLRAVIDDVAPDLAIVQFDPNDTELIMFLRTHHYFRFRRLYLRELPSLLRPGALHDASGIAEGSSTPPERAHLEGWDSLERAYREMRESCDRNGVPMIAVLPFWDVTHDPQARDREGNIQRLLAELEIPVVDTSHAARRWALENKLPMTSLMIDYPRDTHPTPAGHGLMARELLPAVAAALVPRVPALRALAADRGHDAAATETRYLGCYATEYWGDEAVHWTRREARVEMAALGPELVVRYLVSHPDLAAENPLHIVFRINGEPAAEAVRSETGYFEQRIDASHLQGERIVLGVEVDRIFSENGDAPGRELGIALYAVRWESAAQ